MPIKDNNGKVIISLLAGATAGIVAGLLLAPETGEDARKTLAESADKLWNGNLGQKLKDALARFTGPTGPGADSPAHADKAAADARLQNLGAAEPGDLTAPAGAGNGRSLTGDREDDIAEGRS
jgi:hypothetical protein